MEIRYKCREKFLTASEAFSQLIESCKQFQAIINIFNEFKLQKYNPKKKLFTLYRFKQHAAKAA